jgi:dipeptidase E
VSLFLLTLPKKLMNALLLSNSTNFGQSYMSHAKQVVADFLGTKKQVLFIPYAGVTVSYDAYTETVQKALGDHGIQVVGIHTCDNPLEAIQNAEAIVIGGGNTFRLLQQLQEKQLLDPIRESVQHGIPYVGWSAGSNVAGPTLCTTNDMPIVEPSSFECLNLVPYQINPHYSEGTIANHGGESRKARLMEYITLNHTDVICLPESSWLKIQNGQTTYHGLGTMKVYRHPDEVLDFESNVADSYFK